MFIYREHVSGANTWPITCSHWNTINKIFIAYGDDDDDDDGGDDDLVFHTSFNNNNNYNNNVFTSRGLHI